MRSAATTIGLHLRGVDRNVRPCLTQRSRGRDADVLRRQL
jgi:hypothetical protein